MWVLGSEEVMVELWLDRSDRWLTRGRLGSVLPLIWPGLRAAPGQRPHRLAVWRKASGRAGRSSTCQEEGKHLPDRTRTGHLSGPEGHCVFLRTLLSLQCWYFTRTSDLNICRLQR